MVFVFILAATQYTQVVRAQTASQQIQTLAADFEKDSNATVGVSIVDLRNGEKISSLRADELFAPASNQKLVTGALALVKLGGDYKFSTKLYLLDGENLWVQGDWDPTLGDPRLAQEAGQTIYAELDRWGKLLAKSVGDTLDGDIFVGQSASGGRHPDWPKNQHHQWYAAPVAPLNFNNNCFSVTFDVQNSRVIPQIAPASRFIKIVDRTRLGDRHVWSLTSSADDSVVTIRGTVKTETRYPLDVACNSPASLFGYALAERINQAGVRFDGRIACTQPDGLKQKLDTAKLIAETTTPLSVAMNRSNKRSLNMAAECIFLRCCDWNDRSGTASKILTETFGLKAADFVIRDGCGLSGKNRITPAALTKILSVVAERKDAKVFLDSLPISGVDGSLSGRLNEKDCIRRVLGKTGYINGVSCLSGYVLDDKSAPVFAFSIMVNNLPGKKIRQAKQLQDDICRILINSLR